MNFEKLREAVEKAVIVDAHAHNIVAEDSDFPFINGFSEAQGQALSHAIHSLSFKRNLRDISELYGCENSLKSIEQFRRAQGLQSISSMCFNAAKMSALLIDDGLSLDKKLDIDWHLLFVPVVGRILRIEDLAESILQKELPDGSTWTLDTFTDKFVGTLKSLAGDIYGLKSVAAYRSGLEIDPNVSRKDAERGFAEVLRSSNPVRITNKNFIDYIFTCSLDVAQNCDLPVQIHTGFGDKDLDLRLSNPLHLRMVLEDKRFSNCRIVLLHASYPFSKEASYLASVYSQVYLDFGLAVPKLSVHGMIYSVKELLHLAPIKKVMFSTDGYAIPENFYLGAKKAREVIFSVLRDACVDGDLTIHEAIEAVKDIFSENAIQFYKIKLPIKSSGAENGSSPIPETKITNIQSDATLVRILWIDNSGQHRCRVIPSARFQDVVVKNGVGVAQAVMSMPSCFDGVADESGLSGTGEVRLMPDLSTRRRIPWMPKEDMVLSYFHVKPGEPWEYCSRVTLQRVLNILKKEFDLGMNAGFENEFFLLKSVVREGREEWVPFDSSPYSSTFGYDALSPIFQEIFAALQFLGIPMEQIHGESGKGQYELPIGHDTCAIAADNLIYVREVIRGIARKHGLLATFMPKYSLDDLGSGSHVHLSLWRDGKNVYMGSDGSEYGISDIGKEFMAGVLHHLPAIFAFVAPVPNSYDRIQPNMWSGAYQCWGIDNKEAPLRTACPPGIAHGLASNFELKTFDGCANPHLGLAAILAAGIDGLRKHLTLPKPIEANPTSLSEELQRLPVSLSESVKALSEDNVMTEIIGEKLVTCIKGIRKAEIDFYSKNKDAYKDLIYRY